MSKWSLQKKIFLFAALSIVLALLVAIIVFNDEFSGFVAAVNDKLSVLNSLVIGAVIAYLINPVEKFFYGLYKGVKRTKTRKTFSILSAYVLVIGMITLFVLISIPQIAKSVSELPARLQEFVDIMSQKLTVWYDSFITSDFYHTLVETTGKELDINELLASLGETYLNLDTVLNQTTLYVIDFFKKLYTGISDTFIGLIFSVYLLAAKDRLKAQSKKICTALVGPERIDGLLDTLKYTDHAFGGFIQGKLVNAIIIFILTFITFWIFGIPYPQLLALIIGITDVIPVFGPFIGAIPSAFIVLIAAPEKVILMLLIILILQQIDGNYIGPKILGESTGISALGVFVAIIVMGGYYGIVGMLIGVPTFAVAGYLITKYVDKRLVAKGVSTDLEDYYNENDAAFAAEAGIRNSLFTRIIDAIVSGSKALFFGIVRFFKKLPKIRKKSKMTSDNNQSSEIDE